MDHMNLEPITPIPVTPTTQALEPSIIQDPPMWDHERLDPANKTFHKDAFPNLLSDHNRSSIHKHSPHLLPRSRHLLQ